MRNSQLFFRRRVWRDEASAFDNVSPYRAAVCIERLDPLVDLQPPPCQTPRKHDLAHWRERNISAVFVTFKLGATKRVSQAPCRSPFSIAHP